MIYGGSDAAMSILASNILEEMDESFAEMPPEQFFIMWRTNWCHSWRKNAIQTLKLKKATKRSGQMQPPQSRSCGGG
jgi:hypothetical protein